MVNAAFKKFFEKSTIKLDVTIGDTKVSDKNEATLNFKIETNEPRNDYSDHFHEIDVSKTSKITSNTSLDFDRAA
ncbi:hypothetical protein FD19_GL001157 [Lacticaseibacillus thailandensis DSM 22698 = JCM 13996]|uniref:Uncharacterized protein n=2 Tax=Lacticaseibacillus thailandensis TaxID=381741 RepID=A0A0R2CC97_9LACO|nr:hypothetical protein FD19_GL001157 [Lacticaseibacillus thailandensis DSM 22698 = JCM 13996]